MPNVLMKCGCRANAVDGRTGAPSCAIHAGLTPDAEIVADTPDLTGRFAHCSYGRHGRKPSSLALPFFIYQPDAEEDRYYCGCRGWD